MYICSHSVSNNPKDMVDKSNESKDNVENKNDNQNDNNNDNNNNDGNTNEIQYSQCWGQRTLNRDQTAKGRYPTKTAVGGAESLANHSKYYEDTWKPGAMVFSDDHGTYGSHFVNNRWCSSRCTHNGLSFRNPETKMYAAALKGHDNIVESYNNQIKIQRKLHRGMGRVNNGKDWQRQGWLSVLDWINCFTDGSPKDKCITFLQHLYLLLNMQIDSLLEQNKWQR